MSFLFFAANFAASSEMKKDRHYEHEGTKDFFARLHARIARGVCQNNRTGRENNGREYGWERFCQGYFRSSIHIRQKSCHLQCRRGCPGNSRRNGIGRSPGSHHHECEREGKVTGRFAEQPHTGKGFIPALESGIQHSFHDCRHLCVSVYAACMKSSKNI